MLCYQVACWRPYPLHHSRQEFFCRSVVYASSLYKIQFLMGKANYSADSLRQTGFRCCRHHALTPTSTTVHLLARIRWSNPLARRHCFSHFQSVSSVSAASFGRLVLRSFTHSTSPSVRFGARFQSHVSISVPIILVTIIHCSSC